VLPLALIAVILGADRLEGPKTAYVGILVGVPMLAASFSRVRLVIIAGGSPARGLVRRGTPIGCLSPNFAARAAADGPG
jgi:hypothetical protein